MSDAHSPGMRCPYCLGSGQIVNATTIGAIVRHHRQASNLTMKEMSEKCGIGQSYLSEIENDKRTPTITTLQSIAAALHVSIKELLP